MHAEFVRIDTALANVREHSENSALGRRRVLDIAVATTVTPLAFSPFFTTVLEQLPSLEINIHLLRSREGVETLLSGRYHALILPRVPQAQEGLTNAEPGDLHPYHKARGYVAVVQAEAEALAQSTDTTAAGAANEVLAALAGTETAFPSLLPEGDLPANGAELLQGALERVESAARSLQ